MDYQDCKLEEHFDDMEIALIHQVDNANHHLESTASAFWQAYLQRSFPRPWLVLCEQGPDGSLRRVDMKVIYYNSHNRNFSPVLLVEVKRKKGSMHEVEEQGLDAALKAINSQNSTGMYVITAIGLKYRAWYLSSGDRELQPLHGSIERASWEYLHVKQQAGVLNLEETIRLIKGEMPMQQAGVVPSQHIELENILRAEASHIQEGYSVQQAGLARDGQGYGVPCYPSTTYHEQPSEQQTDAQWPGPMDVEAKAESSGEEDELSQAEDSKGKKPRKERTIVNVRVTLIPHSFRKDQCEFRDTKNIKQATLRSDWKEKHDGSKTYFEYKMRPDGKESKQFKYRSDAEIHDSIGLIWCNACPIPCVHRRDQAVGCHRVCQNILTPLPLAEFLQTAAYSCEPTFNQERERRMWLLRTIESRLKLFGTLADELRREIAQYLLQDEAARTNILALTCKKPFQSSFSVRAPFRGNYVTYEGEVYFRSLINEPRRTDDWRAPLAVYVAEDHRGVKRLIWSRIADSKLRGAYGVLYQYSFAIPRHPFKLSRIVNFHGMTDKAPRRMSMFQYNRPEITGFSVCCNPAPITIHTHTQGDDLSFYHSTPADSSWIYVPLEHDEHITSIWIRHPKPLKKMLALAFKTDKGHLHLLGAQATPALSNCSWELLDISNGEPGHFFFDSHPSALRGLIFDSKAPRQPTVLDAPKPVSLHPGLHVCEDFHWSQASVENVVAVFYWTTQMEAGLA
ncbi:hypothetical protein F25303_7517 [Fusarium sp. NRRL 25303]|nr:hypothetical protein F25303_7517 [Fusarium sp. NRRL 25303]